MVSQIVLISNVADHAVKDFRQLGLKAWEIGAPSGQASEGVHLVVTLQVIHLTHWNAHAVCVSTAMRFTVVSYRESDADGEDGDVVRRFDLLGDLVKVQLAEGIHTGGYENDVLAALNLIYAVERVVQSVKQIGFGESGNP